MHKTFHRFHPKYLDKLRMSQIYLKKINQSINNRQLKFSLITIYCNYHKVFSIHKLSPWSSGSNSDPISKRMSLGNLQTTQNKPVIFTITIIIRYISAVLACHLCCTLSIINTNIPITLNLEAQNTSNFIGKGFTNNFWQGLITGCQLTLCG